MPTLACTGECPQHDRLCEREPGHTGDCECVDCPGQRARRRAEMIADRVAAHRIYRELIETTPDVD